jgi:tetratricopeptide (TPR) repeat protein
MLHESEMNTGDPTSQQILDRVWKSLGQKNIREAITQSNLLVQRFPGFAPGWHAASHLAQIIKQPKSALIAIDKALQLEPSNMDWQLHRASCLLLNGDRSEAESILDSLLASWGQLTTIQLNRLAFLFNRLEKHDKAAQVYQSLIEMEPANGGHWYNLASIQRFQGKIEVAESNLNKAIQLNHKDYEAYKLRSDLRRQTADSNHIGQLRNILGSGIPVPSGEVHICYALAKELEDTGQYEQSFKALQRGATVRRKHINYDIKDDLQTIESIIKTFSPACFAGASKGLENDEVIFILGLPRTGTTLVERILGSHDDVVSAGELNNFAMQLMQQARLKAGSQNLDRQQLVRQTSQLDFEALGRAYLDSCQPYRRRAAHFIDKMPLNFLYAGLIHLALPGAKIIHMTRKPMDGCYSIYKCLFQDGYPWSYDLDEIAAYFSAYHALMKHWQMRIPGVIHQVAYEDLVTDFENEARKLVDYCQLDWQQQILNFEKNTTASTTASATQVRQPVYTSSMGRWRDYEKQLAPLAKKLSDAGIRIDG